MSFEKIEPVDYRVHLHLVADMVTKYIVNIGGKSDDVSGSFYGPDRSSILVCGSIYKVVTFSVRLGYGKISIATDATNDKLKASNQQLAQSILLAIECKYYYCDFDNIYHGYVHNKKFIIVPSVTTLHTNLDVYLNNKRLLELGKQDGCWVILQIMPDAIVDDTIKFVKSVYGEWLKLSDELPDMFYQPKFREIFDANRTFYQEYVWRPQFLD